MSPFTIAQGQFFLPAPQARIVALADRLQYEKLQVDTTEGVTTKSLDITLPRNALVRSFDVVVRAAGADQVEAGQAAQLRVSPRTGGVTVVLDFGSPRTVAAVFLPRADDEAANGATAVPNTVTVESVHTWLGSGFADKNVADVAKGNRLVRLTSEVRTERLEVNLNGVTDAATLATGMLLVLPDSPAGIELRIDNGAPVFSNPGPVQPGTEDELTETNWNVNAERTVSLAAALAQLTGDPTATDETVFHLTLTSRVPGDLGLSLRPDGQEIRRIRRAKFGDAAEKEIAFPSEGQVEIELDGLPDNLTVEEVRWTAVATVPAARALPAVGPDAATGVVSADIRVTPDRAINIHLDPATPLGKLTGLRLPLKTGPTGAEARVALWTNKNGALEPLEPIETGVSDPLSLGASEDEAWVSFTWKQPVELPPDGAWAALIVSRGEVAMRFAGNSTPTGWAEVRWGAPQGPWRLLPGEILGLRGRVRMIGTAKAGSPIAPYRLALANGPAQEFTPGPKGVPGVLTATPPAAQNGPTRIVLTSRVAAPVTLREVDVISTT